MMTTPFLTPSVKRFLDAVNAQSTPVDPSPEAQRRGLNQAMATLGWSALQIEPIVLQLPSDAQIQLFKPPGTAPLPLIIYAHGGSFIAGGASHAPTCQALAIAAGAAVALVDYRLAPEHPAPAAVEDLVAATEQLRSQADQLGIDADRFALLGDSAGGALAAATALSLRDRGVTMPRVLVLINPMTSSSASGGSLQEYATGYFAGATDFQLGWEAYGGLGDRDRYYDLLTVEDLKGLPPALVLTNEADPVRDQGERFAEQLSQAGSEVLLLRLRGLIHAAWLFPKPIPEAHLLLDLVSGFVSTRLSLRSEVSQ